MDTALVFGDEVPARPEWPATEEEEGTEEEEEEEDDEEAGHMLATSAVAAVALILSQVWETEPGLHTWFAISYLT